MANFVGYDFSEENNRDLSNRDLRGSDFTVANNLSSAIFDNSDIRDCRFDYSDMTDVDLSGHDISGCSFEGCANIEKAIFTDCIGIETCEFKDTEWRNKEDFSDVTGRNVSIDNDGIENAQELESIDDNTESDNLSEVQDYEDINVFEDADVQSYEVEDIYEQQLYDEEISYDDIFNDNMSVSETELENTNNVEVSSEEPNIQPMESSIEKQDFSTLITKDGEHMQDRVAATENRISSEINEELGILETDEVLSGIENNIDNISLYADLYGDTLAKDDILSKHTDLVATKNVLSNESISSSFDNDKVKDILNKIDNIETKYFYLENSLDVFKSNDEPVSNAKEFVGFEKVFDFRGDFDTKINFNTLCNMVGVSERNESIHRFGTSNSYAKKGTVDRTVEIKIVPENRDSSVLTPYAIGKIDIGNNREMLFVGNLALNENGYVDTKSPRIENINFIGTDGADKRIPAHLKDETGRCSSIDLMKSEIKPFIYSGKDFDGKIDINANSECMMDNLIKESGIQVDKCISGMGGEHYIENAEIFALRNSCANVSSSIGFAIENLECKLDAILSGNSYEGKENDIFALSNNITSLTNDKKEIDTTLNKVDVCYERIEKLNSSAERLLNCENPQQVCTESALYINDMIPLRNDIFNLYEEYDNFVDKIKSSDNKDISKEKFIQDNVSEFCDKYNEWSKKEVMNDDDIATPAMKDNSYEARQLHIGEDGSVYNGVGINSAGYYRINEQTCKDDNPALDNIQVGRNDDMIENMKGKIIQECKYPNDTLLAYAGKQCMLVEAETVFIKNTMVNDECTEKEAYDKLESIKAVYLNMDSIDNLTGDEINDKLDSYLKKLSSLDIVSSKQEIEVAVEKDNSSRSIKDIAKKSYDKVSNFIDKQSKIMGRLAHGDVLIIGAEAIQAVTGLLAGEEKYKIKNNNGEEKIEYYSVADVISSSYFVLTSSPTAITNAFLYRALNYVCTRTIDIAISNLVNGENDKIDKDEVKVLNSNDDRFLEDGTFETDVNKDIVDNSGIALDDGKNIPDDTTDESITNDSTENSVDKSSPEEITNDKLEEKIGNDLENGDLESDNISTDNIEVIEENDNLEANIKEEFNPLASDDNSIGDVVSDDEEIKDDTTHDANTDISRDEQYNFFENSDPDENNDVETKEDINLDEENNDIDSSTNVADNEKIDSTSNDINDDIDKDKDKKTDLNEDVDDSANNNIEIDNKETEIINSDKIEKLDETVKQISTDFNDTDKNNLTDRLENVLNGDISISEGHFSEFIDKNQEETLNVITDSISEKLNEAGNGIDKEETIERVASVIVDLTSNGNYDVPVTSLENIQDIISKKIKDKDTEEKLFDAVATLVGGADSSNDVENDSFDTDNSKGVDEISFKFEDEYNAYKTDDAGSLVFANNVEIPMDNESVDKAVTAVTNEVNDVTPLQVDAVINDDKQDVIEKSIDSSFDFGDIFSKDDIIKTLESLQQNLPDIINIALDPVNAIQDIIKDEAINAINSLIAEYSGVDILGTIDDIKEDVKDTIIDAVKEVFSSNSKIDSVDNSSNLNDYVSNDTSKFDSIGDSTNDILAEKTVDVLESAGTEAVVEEKGVEAVLEIAAVL